MIDRRIGKIKVRRGTDEQRVQTVFDEGELVYSLDKKRLYVGDGKDSGGILVSNKNYITDLAGSLTPPSECVYGDIIHDKPTGRTYIVDYLNYDNKLTGGYTLILIADNLCCSKFQSQIDDIYSKLKDYSWCLDGGNECPPCNPITYTLQWAIQPISITASLGSVATFTASAVGVDDIIYKWVKLDNNTIIPNKIQTYFDIVPVQSSDVGNYVCIATSLKVGSITSNPAMLDVKSGLFQWVIQPQSQSSSIGYTVTLNSSAITDIGNIVYEWKRRDSINIPAPIHNNDLKIATLAQTDYATYYCEAKRLIGTTWETISSNDALIYPPDDSKVILSELSEYTESEDGFVIEWT